MDLTQLKYFLTAARSMNFTRAARELFITRQALSQSIQGLEQYLGTTLFQRQNNRLTLTPSGILLKEKAPEILQMVNNLELEIRQQAKQFEGISLAFSPSILDFLFASLPDMLKHFSSSHQNLPLNTMEAGNDQILELLQMKKIRFGLMILMPPEDSDLNYLPLHTFRLGLSMSRSHPLAGEHLLHVKDLNNQHLIGMGNLSTSYPALYRCMKEKKITAELTILDDPIEAFYHVKKAGYLMLDAADYPDFTFPGIKVIPLENMEMHLCLIYRHDMPLMAPETFFVQYFKNWLELHPLQPASVRDMET